MVEGADDVNKEMLQIHEDLKGIKKGQDQLHKDHQKLTLRVNSMEQEMAADRQALVNQTDRNDLMHNQMGSWMKDLKSQVGHWIDRFDKHAERENNDRTTIIKSQRNVIWMLTLFFLSTMGGVALLLIDTWKIGP